MRLFFSLLLCLSMVFQGWIMVLPVSAVDSLAPEQQGLHFNLLQVEWGEEQVKVRPMPDFLPTTGLFLGGWALGASVYLVSQALLQLLLPLIGYSPAFRDISAMTLSVFANAGFVWSVGNWGFSDSGYEGDFGITLAGTLLGQSLYMFQTDLNQANEQLNLLEYVNWSFSSLGSVSGYYLSLHPKF